MSPFFKLLSSVWRYKVYTCLGIFFHILTALLTVISIPLVIPFFQILFGVSPSNYKAPSSIWDLENALNYGFSRLIAMTDHFVALWIICITVVVVFFLKNLCRFLISFFMVHVRNGLLRDLRKSIWQSYESMSLTKRYHHQQGYLMSLITNDLSEVDHGILKVFEMLFKTPLVILGSLIFMLFLNAQLTLIAFALILFTLIVIGGVSRVLKSASLEAQETLSSLTVVTDQYLSGTKIIRTHHADGYFKRKFNEFNERYFKISDRILRRRDLASPLAEFLGVVTIVVLLYFGTHAVFNDEMEPATFFAFIFAFYNIIDPAKSFAREYANVQKGMAALDRITLFNEDVSKYKSYFVGSKTAQFASSLKAEEISFSYDQKEDVLSDVSIEIKPGDRIGLVGTSGTGKTTLIDVILGFFIPQNGRLLLDGQPISEYKEDSYRDLFGLISQRTHLFHGSIKDNIVLDKAYDDILLDEVIKQVGLDAAFVDKAVGDQNTMISGGEAQRVSLARLLYRSPKISLLDEPTAQLDSASAAEMMNVIMECTKEKTVIMISHQIPLLKDMDEIWVLNNGKIVDKGQYDSLYDRNVHFRHLVEGTSDLDMG